MKSLLALLAVLSLAAPLAHAQAKAKPKPKPPTGPLFPISVGGKFGLMDKHGKEVVKPELEEVRDYYEGLVAAKKDGKWGYLDAAGRWAIKPQFENTGYFSEGLSWIMSGPKTGFIDKKGKTVIPLQFAGVKAFNQGYNYVQVGKLWGVIDKNGKFVIQPNFTGTTGFEKGGSYVQAGTLWAYLDIPTVKKVEAGNPKFDIVPAYSIYQETFYSEEVSPGSFDCFRKDDPKGERQHCSGFMFTNGSAVACQYGKVQLDPDAGKIWVSGEPKSDGCDFSYGEGMLGVVKIAADKSKTFGFMTKDGELAVPPRFDEVGLFSEGLAKVREKDKWGFSDKTGKLVIAPAFEAAGSVKEGMIAVKLGGKWGYADTTGAVAVPSKFEKAEPFKDGLAKVTADGKTGYIDKTGNYVWGPL